MFQSHKSFPFFLLKKRKEKNNSLSHTQNLLQQTLVCSRAPKHKLFIGIVLTQSSFVLWPRSSPHRVQRFGEQRQLCEVQ